MKAKVKTLNITGICLIVLQLFSYLGSEKSTGSTVNNGIAYYIGYNSFLITAVILFIVGFLLRRKLKGKEKEEMIDSIGKN